tara:strand:+ start:1804 stop:2559 length:756 start_codon:yes stop_codon:yes gene_type:complete
MTATVMSPFNALPAEVQSYIKARAANYDSYTHYDLFRDLPEAIQDNPEAIMGYLKGVPELGVEAREVMHGISEANGGLDVPSNLQLGPASINDSMGSDNLNAIYQNLIDSSNGEAVDVLLSPENADILSDVIQLGEATTTTTAVIAASTDAATVVDATEAGLSELVGEALVEGLVPAIFAGKAAMAVADNCETTEDKLGYGSLAAGGTVLLYANPVTGPIAWTATGVYSGYKLARLGWKLWGKQITDAVYG